MSNGIHFLDPDDIRYLHEDALEEYGGHQGENEPGMIDYMSEKPFSTLFNKEMYPSIFQKAAVYLEGFATHQYFADGNKRTGVKCCLTFLLINGYELTVDDYELYDVALKVATKEMNIDEIADWLKNNTIENRSFM